MAIMIQNIVLVGDSSGKTTLIKNLIGDDYPNTPLKAYGLDCYIKKIETKYIGLKLNIWDTTDEGLFLNYDKFISQIQAFIFVYSITNRQTFEYIKERMEDCLPKYPTVRNYLVGNLNDLVDIRQISTEEGFAFANLHSMIFYEIRALDNGAVDNFLSGGNEGGDGLSNVVTLNTEIVESIVDDFNKNNIDQHITNYKCILLGSQGVGKTSLLSRYINSYLPTTIDPTLIDYTQNMPFLIDDELVEINIIDTCYNTINNQNSFDNIDIAILVYSITDRQTFNEMKTILNRLKEKASSAITCVIIGNKNDLIDQREITYEEAKWDSQENLNISFNETNVYSEARLVLIFKHFIPVAKAKRREKKRISSQLT